MKRISVLGSTGSIGTQTLDVCRRMDVSVAALAAGSNTALLEEQAREFRPELVAVFDEASAAALRISLADTDIKVVSGAEGVKEAAACFCDIVFNAVTGIAGLAPSLAAIEAGNTLALANKETLVAGGKRVMDYAAAHGVKILPVDSEHSAVFQCLQAKGDSGRIGKLILTASGGPFFGKSREELAFVRPEDALRHPTWTMGRKVTVDSATMANKGLEIMEAAHLFGVTQDKIEVIIHRESMVHSMVEFIDHSVLAQLGVPDMRTPIQYALTWPERLPSAVKQINLTEIGALTFYRPDDAAFPSMRIARRALSLGGTAGAAFNAADEVAVAAFLDGRIGFNDIPSVLEKTVEMPLPEGDSFEAVFAADREARAFAASLTDQIRR
jgi:1-deoxy-D-xylulose-5-phosphate reductoisomerase